MLPIITKLSAILNSEGVNSEYLGVSALTGKRVKGDNNSVIKEHNLFCNH